jgi:hypothetical protein
MDKTTLLNSVNGMTGRNETATTFDPWLLEVLIEMSARTRYLKTSTTGTTTADQNYISVPSDMAGSEIDGLVINDARYDPISWDDFMGGKKEGYVVMGDSIYLSPTPGAYSYTLYYSKVHPTSLTTILFPDVFQPAVEHGCAAKVYAHYEIMDKLSSQLTLFENEMQKFSGYGQPPPVCKPFRGI